MNSKGFYFENGNLLAANNYRISSQLQQEERRNTELQSLACLEWVQFRDPQSTYNWTDCKGTTHTEWAGRSVGHDTDNVGRIESTPPDDIPTHVQSSPEPDLPAQAPNVFPHSPKDTPMMDLDSNQHVQMPIAQPEPVHSIQKEDNSAPFTHRKYFNAQLTAETLTRLRSSLGHGQEHTLIGKTHGNLPNQTDLNTWERKTLQIYPRWRRGSMPWPSIYRQPGGM